MKILIVADPPFIESGYARLGRSLAKRLLADGHEPIILGTGAFGGGSSIMLDGIQVLGTAWRDDRWANTAYGQYLSTLKPDLVISLLDVQGMNAYGTDPTPWWAWAPIDTWPVTEQEQGLLMRAERVLVPSRWGIEQCALANIPSEYLPYGVEAAEHTFDAEARRAFRTQIGVDDDTFLVGMIGLNYVHPDRKGLQFAMEALALLAERYPGRVRGWLHYAYAFDGATDLHVLRKALGLDNILALDDPPPVGYASAETMRAMYSGFDVLLQASMTEGFGLPTVEAQLNGLPVVINGGTALRELAGPGSTICEPAGHLWTEAVTKVSLPSVPNLLAGLDVQFRQWEWARDAGLSGVRDIPVASQRLAWAQQYDWDHVYDVYWRPLLAQVPDRLSFGDHTQRPKLQVGCGNSPIVGYVHHDRTKHADFVDVAFNLDQFPWPLEDDSFGIILCNDVIEHLRGDIPQILDEFWRVLEPGGWLTIGTCDQNSWMAAFDPTHLRGFNLHSFDYFDPALPWGQKYGMEVGHAWRIVRRSLSGGQIEVILQSRKGESSDPSPGERTNHDTGCYEPDQHAQLVAP